MEHQNELRHYGVRGQRWGIRRYQNPDGTLTPAGRRRADKMKEEYTALTGKRLIRKPTKKSANDQKVETVEKKRIRDMSDEEIKNKINRLENEKRLAGLEADTATTGQKIARSVAKDVVAPAAIDAGKRLLTDLLMKVGKEKLGLNGPKADAADEVLKELRKENETLSLKKSIATNKKWLEDEAAGVHKTKQAEKAAKKEAKKAAEKEAEKPAKENNDLLEKYKKMYDEVDRELGETTVRKYENITLPGSSRLQLPYKPKK